MSPDEMFGVIAVVALLAFLIYLPVRFFMLIGQVRRLEQEVSLLASRRSSTLVRSEPEAVAAFRRVVDRAEGRTLPFEGLERFAFYAAAKQGFCVVRTSEFRPYGCFLFTMGVIFDGR